MEYAKIEYNMDINGEVVQLPDYSQAIADKIYKASLVYYSQMLPIEKSNALHKFVCEIVGKQIVEKTIGKSSNVDLNILELFYKDVIEVYSKPLDDVKKEELSDMLNGIEIDKILEMTKAIPQLKELSRTK